MACTQLVQVENNEMQDKEEEVARPSLKYAYGRRDIAPIFSGVSRFHKRNELDNEKRQVQASNMFSQLTSDHQVKVHLEKQQREILNSPATFTRGVEEIEDEETNTRWQTYRTLTDNRTGAPNNHQQKAVVDDQPVPAEKDVHNNNQMENDMINKEDEQTNFRVDFQYFYERRKGKLQTSSEVSSIFSQLTSRHKARLEGQRRDVKISPATNTRVETAASKSSPKKGRGQKSKALTGRSSRSVPRQRKRKSDIQEIEDEDLNNRRQTYILGKNEKAPLIFDHSSEGFELVDTHIGYQESLLKFAKDLGPIVQSIAFKKLEQLGLAQTTAHAFHTPVLHQPSSAWSCSEDPKGKSVIMDRGCGRNSVSAKDTRPMRPLDRVGTFSPGSAYTASLPGASGIQKSTNVVHISGESVHFPSHNHNQSVLQQHLMPPSNAAVLNANAVRPGYQIPTVYEAQRMQIASTPIRPSRLSRMCTASGSGYGVWGGHQSTPLNDLQRHDSNSQLQNQHGLGAHQQQQPLPILSNMFDIGTFSSARNHQTTSNAGRSAQQLPLAHRSCTNLELQLRTKPLSPDETS